MPVPPAFPAGSLAVVSVPIGHPGDITARAVEVLRDADLVAAEDTRTARRLLAAHGLKKPLVSYHDWNEAERAGPLLARLARGERVALVSEAGTPGLSDPGFDLVRAARRSGTHVFPVPGASALTAFLSVAGLPTDAFTFLGFPPARRAARRAAFARVAERPETLVFYESARRILSALEDAREVFGDRECALGREMTKVHEEFLFGPLSAVAAALASRPRVLGEVCWGVCGATGKAPRAEEDPGECVRRALASGAPLREAARDLAERLRISSKEAYRLLLAARRGGT